MISARKIHDPSSGLITQRVLADPADAGVLRVDALLHRAGVDVGARVERLRTTRRASRRAARRAARRDHVVVVVAPRVPRDVRATGIARIRSNTDGRCCRRWR